MDKHITTPITEEVTADLHSGDYVYITGEIYVARDAAHKRMIEALDRGDELPIDMQSIRPNHHLLIYYEGHFECHEGHHEGHSEGHSDHHEYHFPHSRFPPLHVPPAKSLSCWGRSP